MPEAQAPPDAPAAPPAAEAQKPPPPPKPKRNYTYRFEPIGDFDEDEMYIRGRVRGRIWISPKLFVEMRSVLGKETDEVYDLVRIEKGMSQDKYNTEITYHSIAQALEKIGDKPFQGTLSEKVTKLREMAGPLNSRMQLAYIEFSDHVQDIFIVEPPTDGKPEEGLGKKS